MRLFLCALIAVAVAVPSARCDGMFDDGQEYIYNYNGITSTGVKEPAVFGSAFGIQATITVQRKGEFATIKLDGIQLAVGNGPEELLRQAKYVKKADLTAVLEKPFRVKYSQGKIVGFEVDPTEPLWSVNIKKGIATPLQLDVTVGAAEVGRGENAYIKVDENTVVGKCKTSYTFGATDALGKGFNLIKQRTSQDCADYPKIEASTFTASTCDKTHTDSVLTTSHVYYVLERTSKQSFKASLINTFGYQIQHLFQPRGVPAYNFANTTFFLKKTAAIAKQIDASTCAPAGDLKFAFRALPPKVQDDVDLTKSDLHIYHPEEPKDQKFLQTKFTECIAKLAVADDASAVDKKALQDQTLFEAFQYVAGLDTKTFKAVFDKIKGNVEQRKVFIDLVAQSGGSAGALFLKDVISKGEFDDQEIRRVLAEFPFHLRSPTEKLLAEFEGMLKKSPFKEPKNERAFLFSFAHLAQKTCRGNRCKEDTTTRIGKALFEKFSKAKTYEEQVTAVIALRNFGNAAALEKLIPYTKAGVDRSLRMHTINALLPLAHTNRDRLMSVVLPIYLNVTESTEIRIAAVAVVMNSRPTFLDLQQIVAGVVWDRNPQVVNFIVTSFKSYSEAKNPCISQFANRINLLLRRISHLKTRLTFSSNRYYDFSNDDYGFGGAVQIATVYGDESRVPVLTVFRVGYRVGEYNYIPLEVAVRLEGVEDTIVKVFRKLDAKEFKIADLQNVLKKLNVATRSQNPFKMEIGIRYNQQTIFYRHLDAEKLRALTGFAEKGVAGLNFGVMLKEVIGTIRNQLRGILLGSAQFSWRPNELGIPVCAGVSTPKHRFTSESFSKAEGKLMQYNIDMEGDLRLYSMNYMMAYNPLGASQGVIKYRASRVHIPFNAVVGVNMAEQALTVSLKTHTENKAVALHMTAGTVVMIYGKDDKRLVQIMEQSCKTCKTQDLVTAGKQFLKGEVIRDAENERLGLHSHIEIYDCEQYSSKSALGRLLYQTLNPNQMNTGGRAFGYAVMAFMHLRNFLSYYPPAGACSMLATLHQAKENPTTELQFTFGRDQAVPKKAGVDYSYFKGSLKLVGTPARQYDMKLQIERAPQNVKSKVAVYIERHPVESLGLVRRATCFDIKTAWSAIPDDIMEIPSAVEPSAAREVKFLWGEIQKSGDCPDPKLPGTSSVTITGNATITDEQRQAAQKKDRYPFNQCAADRTADGRTGAVAPLTQACYDAVVEYATPQSVLWNMSYKQISNRGMKFLIRAQTLFRTIFMAYWDMHIPGPKPKYDAVGPNAQNTGNVELQVKFNNAEKDAEIHIHTDNIHDHYSNVGRFYKYKSVIRNTRLSGYESLMYNLGLVSICDVAPKKVTTYDQVQYEYSLPKCWTLASADCSAEPRFAVFVKKSDDKLPVAARFYVGGHVVELNPKGGALGFSINGKDFDCKLGDKYQFPDAESPMIVVSRFPGRLSVRAVTQRTTVRYTGDDVDVFVPATYISTTCGLCGDYNGQPDREFRGPSGCSLATGQDVANAFVLKDECKESIPAANCIEKAGGGKDKGKASIADFIDLYTLRQ